jgi:hypothetical protein
MNAMKNGFLHAQANDPRACGSFRRSSIGVRLIQLGGWSRPVAVAVNADQNALRNAETLVPTFM